MVYKLIVGPRYGLRSQQVDDHSVFTPAARLSNAVEIGVLVNPL